MNDSLLNPSLSSIYEVLARPGECFYIPAYQRSFAWGKDEIERLFEDMVYGIRNACSETQANGDTVTFMGTIVCFQDWPPYHLVHPFIHNDMPASVLAVIDGQQRLTMGLIIALILHDFLRTTKFKLPDNEEEESELNSQKLKIMGALKSMLQSSGETGDRPYYPRMIRGPLDIWSLRAAKSKYSTPLSSLISQYIDFYKVNSDKKSFKFDCENKNFKRAYTLTKRYINALANPDDSVDLQFDQLPKIVDIFSSRGAAILQNLFSITRAVDFFADATKAYDEAQSKEEADPAEVKKLLGELNKQKAVARALLISEYFMQRIKFVKMVTKSDDYAYRIFDSLNTTGDPLTAYETFKPEVVKSYGGQDDYYNSNERIIMDEISHYLDNLPKGEQSRKTKELLVQFALAENGEKLSKNLSEQRKYLMDEYEKTSKKDFIKCLSETTHVFETFNSKAGIQSTKFFSLLSDHNYIRDSSHQQWANEARFCLRFIIDAGHSICISLLSRFYALVAPSPDQKISHLELCKAICSTAAFFAMWRISRPNTDNIDMHHRKIMRQTTEGSIPELDFMRRGNSPEFPKLNNEYSRLLRQHNIRPITDSESWVKLSHTIPVYSNAGAVAKFILLLDAYHPQVNHGVAPHEQYIFNELLWTHPAHASIEHIKPKSSGIRDATEEKELLDSIGNLTLLPIEINSYIGDVEWKKRKSFYEAISSTTVEEYNAKAAQVPLDQDVRDKVQTGFQPLRELLGTRRLPYIKKITEYTDFGYEEIKERGNGILENAWKILQKWINLSTLTK